MEINGESKYRNQYIKGIFILSIIFCLAKGQSCLSAAADCSSDPVETTVELVLSELPDYGSCFHQLCIPSTAVGTTFAPSENGFLWDYPSVFARHDAYARLVLKSTDDAFVCQPRNNLLIKTRTVSHHSSDSDPLPILP